MTVSFTRYIGAVSRTTFRTSTLSSWRAVRSPQCVQLHVSSRNYALATSKPGAKPTVKASTRQPPTAANVSPRPKASSYLPVSGKARNAELNVLHGSPKQKIILKRPSSTPPEARERIAYATSLERDIDALFIRGTPTIYSAPKRVGALLAQSLTLSTMLTGFSGLLIWQYLTAMNDGLPLWVPAINMVVTGGLLCATVWIALAPCKLIQTMRAVRRNGQAYVEVTVKSYPLLPTTPKQFLLEPDNMRYPPAIVDVRRDILQYRKAVKERGEAREAMADGLMKSWHRWQTRASLARYNGFIAVQMCFFRHGLANLRSGKQVIGKLDARGDWQGAMTST